MYNSWSKAKNKETKKTQWKNGQGTQIDIFPRETYCQSTGTWKYSQITNHQRNANQNHNMMSSYTCQDGFDLIKIQISNFDKDVEKKEPCILLVGM